MLYFYNLYKEKNHHFILQQIQIINGIRRKLFIIFTKTNFNT